MGNPHVADESECAKLMATRDGLSAGVTAVLATDMEIPNEVNDPSALFFRLLPFTSVASSH